MGEGSDKTRKVLIADAMPSICEKILSEAGVSIEYKPNITLEQLVSEIPYYHGLVVRSKTKVTKEIIDVANKLEIIGRPGAGFDNIDIDAANKKGIAVVNTPFSNKYSVAELVFSYMIALSRSLVRYDNDTKKGGWTKGKLLGKELYDKTIGVVGLGNIGKEVAKRAEAFNMNIIYYDPYTSEPKYKNVSLEELFEKSDFVTVHVPSKEDTNNLIIYNLLSKMKKNAIFINTSRAEVVQKDALEKILQERQDLKAALDVFYDEKEGKKEIAKLADRVILTPHIGASTEDAQIRGAKGVAEQIIEFFKSGRAAFALNLEKLDEHYLPYRELAEKIAYLSQNIIETKPNRIEITCYSDLEKYSKAFLNIALMPVLKYKSDLFVNEVNAAYLAKARGIETKIREPDNSKRYGDTITLDLVADANEISIRGTIDDNKIKLMRIGNFAGMSIVAEGKQLMVMYDESYGILEAIGHVLAKYKISAVSMNSGGDKRTGRELSFLKTRTDNLLNEQQLNEIKEEILKRRGITIKDNVNVYQVKHLDFDNLF